MWTQHTLERTERTAHTRSDGLKQKTGQQSGQQTCDCCKTPRDLPDHVGSTLPFLQASTQHV